MIHNIIKDKSTKLFMILAGFFIANALIAEMIGVKVFSLEDTIGIPRADFSLFGEKGLSFSLTAGVLPWPVVFIMTDIVNEYYGVKGVRFLTLLTAALISFAFIVFFFAIRLMPDTNYWLGSGTAMGVPDMQAAYTAIFGQGMNIIIGSLTAFMLGQLIDALVFRKIKVFTGEKNIWARATLSTVVSQFIDSVVVTYVAFTIFRGVPVGQSMAWAFTAYAYKFLVAISFTPVIYLVHYACEGYLGKEKAAEMKMAALKGY
jgi:queuosine precursor transporter